MPEPKLRKDAARNRERLLAAGRELLAERGLAVSLNDIAHHAGVGVGTAYRRFANKEELIDAILVEQIEELEGILHEALDVADPWDGLVQYLERSLAAQVKDRGMGQILAGWRVRPDQHDRSHDRLAPLVNEVARRARDAGAIRPDATGTDLIFLQIALLSIAVVAQDGPPVESRPDVDDLHRRYLWIALDGLRPGMHPPTPLPVPALTTQETHTLLRAGDGTGEPAA